MSKKFIISIITLIVIAASGAAAIFLAKGYTFSTKEKRIMGTGIITVSSEPDSAPVLVDGHLTTATNATISSLPPKKYTVKIVKEGFIPWEKEIDVKEGLVSSVKATLFPAIPTIYPLTFNGVDNPVLSSDGSKLAYIVPSGKKGGVWVWTQMRNQPISFARSAEPHQIARSVNIDFAKATLRWSADSKQVLATVSGNNYLLEADRLNDEPRDIAPVLQTTLKSWEEDTQSKDDARILAIVDKDLRQIASSSAVVRWSPDETKFMLIEEGTTGGKSTTGTTGAKTRDARQSRDTLSLESVKVYDLEDGQSTSDKKEYTLPTARSHIWLPDSRHIILVDEGMISVVDFDGTNKAVIYAGSFQDDFVYPWLDSSRLVIISSFPTPTASEPNLYGINLK